MNDGPPIAISHVNPDADEAQAAAQSRLSLTHRTARGFLWVTLEALSSKAVNMVAQMVLARLLLPEHWGLVGLAFTVSVFADLLAGAGFREVLVQRGRRFHLWAPPAFWLSLTFGLLAALGMVAVAPLVTGFYEAPGLTTLIYVLAIASPIMSLACVPEAAMRIHMRFRPLSVLNSGRNVGVTLASVALAAFGAGAMSFVLPRPIFALAYAAGAWLAAPTRISIAPHVRRWRYLLSDSLMVLVASLVLMVIGQAGFIVLGRLGDETTVGYYYFAYNLSLQTAVLLGLNVAGVLFPALASLQDQPDRQRAAFVRASRMLAVAGFPMCALQAALAAPIIGIFYGERMAPAAAIFTVLSLGMGYHVLWNPSRSLLQSGGRFGLSLLTLSSYAAVFVPAVTVGALTGGGLGVAIATAIVFTLAAPIETYIAMRSIGGTWKDLWTIYGEPTIISAIAVAPWAWIATMLPDGIWWQWLELIAIPVLSIATLIALLAWRMPSVLADIRERMSGVMGARRHS